MNQINSDNLQELAKCEIEISTLQNALLSASSTLGKEIEIKLTQLRLRKDQLVDEIKD